MYNRSQIKRASKASLKNHYWRNIFIALIAVITVTGSLNSLFVDLFKNRVDVEFSSNVWFYIKSIITYYIPDFLNAGGFVLKVIPNELVDASLGFAVNLILTPISFPFYIAYAVYQTNFESSIQIFYVILGVLLYVAFIVFILFPLHTSSLKYFLDKEKNQSDKNPMLFSFKNYYKNIIITKCLVSLKYMMWSLTVVMIPYKYYQYSLVDYILCDNPSMSPRDVIETSKRLTDGKKMKLFMLDISFIPYEILSLFTLGLLDILFLSPYIQIAKAKVYNEFKGELLADDLSANIPYDLIKTRNKEGILLRREVEYDCPYTLVDYILIFFIVSMVGWFWEVCLHFLQTFTFANRGTLYGPWLPIYGTGGVVVLFLLKGTRKRPFLTFILSIVICLTIEYFTGWFLEVTKGLKYWDYSDMPLNLNGRICLYGGLIFGFGCIVMIYFLGPFLYSILANIKPKTKWIISSILLTAFVADIIVSAFYPNSGEGVTTPANMFKVLSYVLCQ